MITPRGAPSRSYIHIGGIVVAVIGLTAIILISLPEVPIAGASITTSTSRSAAEDRAIAAAWASGWMPVELTDALGNQDSVVAGFIRVTEGASPDEFPGAAVDKNGELALPVFVSRGGPQIGFMLPNLGFVDSASYETLDPSAARVAKFGCDPRAGKTCIESILAAAQ